MPVDLEWPRRAIVGAIVVIGRDKAGEALPKAPGVLYCGETKDPPRTIPPIQCAGQIAGLD